MLEEAVKTLAKTKDEAQEIADRLRGIGNSLISMADKIEAGDLPPKAKSTQMASELSQALVEYNRLKSKISFWANVIRPALKR